MILPALTPPWLIKLIFQDKALPALRLRQAGAGRVKRKRVGSAPAPEQSSVRGKKMAIKQSLRKPKNRGKNPAIFYSRLLILNS